MALFNLFNNTEKIYHKFYEKTGIQITDEPIGRHPSDLNDTMERMFYLARKDPKKALPELEKLVKQYPDFPSLKNYLYICYTKLGLKQKAEKIVDLTIREHPDYIFGFTVKIMQTVDKKEMEQYGYLLGSPRDIRTIKPNAEVYHISEFVSYQSAAGTYEAVMGDEKSALERLESLMDLDVEKAKLREVANRIGLARIQNGISRFQESSSKRIEVESFPKVEFEPTEDEPLFENFEIKVLYGRSTGSIKTKEIEELLLLPRESFIRDLELVLLDSIRRKDYFSGEPYHEKSHEFIVHALYFLGALKSEGSLQKVLDLLRMGEGFTEYWFGDMATEFMYPTLYALGENQLEVLKDFVLEPNLFPYDRMQASKIPAQVALQQPERRAEVVKWYEAVFNHLLENENDKNLIDSGFISFSVGDVLDFRGKELWTLIEKLYAKGWVQDTIQGDLEEMKKEINQPGDPYFIEPLPLNIHEYYSREYNKRKAKVPAWKTTKLSTFHLENQSKAEQMVMDSFSEILQSGLGGKSKLSDDNFYDDYEEMDDHRNEPVQQVKRIAPKVGRNDPCPCGSGKKHKKCCMKK